MLFTVNLVWCVYELGLEVLLSNLACAIQVCVMVHSGSRGLGHQVATGEWAGVVAGFA